MSQHFWALKKSEPLGARGMLVIALLLVIVSVMGDCVVRHEDDGWTCHLMDEM